jgi:tetratricopeptide (TPR) repeat protein
MKEARELVKKGSWLEARDMLEYVVSVEAGNSEAQNLLKQAVEKETTLMETLGRASRLPRYSEDRAGLVEGFLRRGKQFLEAGNQQDALVSLTRGLAIIELDSGLKRFEAQFKTEMSKIKADDDKKELWRKGVEARNAYEYEDALKYLSKLPKNYDVQLPSLLAECYWKTGDSEQAMQMARYQLTIQKDNNRAKFVLASIFLENGDKDSAFNYFKEIYDSDPDYPELKDKLLQSSAAKWKSVLPLLALLFMAWLAYAIYKYLPEYNKNSSLRKSQSFLKREMLDECIAELVKIKRLPNLTQFDGALISRILAQAYLKKGIYDRAIGECKHLISIMPKDEEAHSWLGYAYLGRRMLSPESLPELLNLYAKDPRNIALVSLLGSHYTQAKNLSDDGIKILEQWLNLDPNNPEVLKPLGRYYLKKGRSDDKSMKVFQKMMELGSPEAEFLLGVAKIHLKLRQFDSCLHLCEQVINSDVNNELVHSVLREAYHKQNRLDELLDIYGNFLQNNPYNVAFQNGLRDAQKLAGNEAARRSQQPDASPRSPQQDTAPDQLVCPSCQQLNSSKDYLCQHCGQNLA